jgi:adenine-specific DNA-methyltransferase
MATLNWIGRSAVENHHKEVPFHLLKCDNKLSVGDPDSGNLLVQGDNLLALKALLPYYAEQVKCIYIDPPYNTGNEKWIYNDNVNSPEIREWLGKVVGNDLEDMTRHEKWLCMMYPRLMLLKSFLRSDGFICVQIDDNECANLKALMDEIFHPLNYLATIYVQVRYETKTLKKDMVFHKQIEQILVYRRSAMSKPNLKSAQYLLDKFKWYVEEKQKGKEIILGNKKVIVFKPEQYKIKEGESSITGLKEIWASGSILDGNSSGRFFRDYLSGRAEQDGLSALYKVYGIGEDSFDYRYFTGPKRIKASRGKYYQGVPREIIEQVQNKMTELPILNFYDMAADFGNCRHEGGVEFKSGKKPERLISLLLSHFSDEGDIILDSFAGSGTTSAVAHKMRRHWIAVEMGEHCYTHTIPRLTSVTKGSDDTGISKTYHWYGDVGFRFCTLGSTLFDANGHIRDEVKFDELARHVFFIETGEPLPKRNSSKSPLLGVSHGRAVYLLYNGILGDKSTHGGNVLSRAVLESLPSHESPKVVYGTRCLLSAATQQRLNVKFKQIPYAIKVE